MLDEVAKIANEQKTAVGTPVGSRTNPDRAPLVAETAFLLAKYRNSDDEIDLNEAEGKVRSFLERLPRSEGVNSPLNEFEWFEVNDICDNILAYTYWLKEVTFSPSVPGCGVVDGSIADAIAPNEIIEIKAISRPFRSSDFKQILTYLAMFYSKGQVFDKVTLLNPRNGCMYQIKVDKLSKIVSGRASVELMQEIMQWMMSLQVSA